MLDEVEEDEKDEEDAQIEVRLQPPGTIKAEKVCRATHPADATTRDGPS